MCFVYIIHSPSADVYYVGQTNDFSLRLQRHNSGQETYTRIYAPWEKVLVLSKPSRSEAMKLERRLKNLNRERLLAFIEKYSADGI
jgi:putative endonuclease